MLAKLSHYMVCHVTKRMYISPGASSLGPSVTRGKVAGAGGGGGDGIRADSSEGETGKPEKPPRTQYQGEEDGGRERRKRKKRRSERGSSLHEELLEFISQEWASLEIAEVHNI